MVEEIIENRLVSNPDWEMRVIQAEFLENIAVKGKVQYIEILGR